MDLKPCNRNYFPEIEDDQIPIPKEYWPILFPNAMCLQNPNFNLAGYLDEQLYQRFEVDLLVCVNDSKYFENITCRPQDEINATITKYYYFAYNCFIKQKKFFLKTKYFK